MKIIGCDFHTRYQQIAMLDEETGELIERRTHLRCYSGRMASSSQFCPLLPVPWKSRMLATPHRSYA